MSADAKVWHDDGLWFGKHDGDCHAGCEQRTESPSLIQMLQIIERCGAYHYHWEFRAYPDGTVGLVGWCAGGSPYTGVVVAPIIDAAFAAGWEAGFAHNDEWAKDSERPEFQAALRAFHATQEEDV